MDLAKFWRDLGTGGQWLVAAAVLLAVVFSLVDRGGVAAEPGAPVTSSSTTERQLAAIDAGSPIVPDGAEAPYRTALDRLVPKCTESRTLLADMAVKTKQILADEGARETTALSLLRGVDQALPLGSPELACADIFGMIAARGAP